MPEKTSLSFSNTINSSADSVYLALTNAALLQQWLCTNAQVSANEGGRIYMHWQQGYYMCGEFTELVPNEKVTYQWQGKNEPFVTQIHITLEEKDGQTAVSLTHADIPADEKWQTVRDEYTKGWENGLANLKSVLETGLDKRIYDQAFLGILIGGVLTAEQAKERQLPTEGGIVISGTLDETGASAIGLQNEDVLVNLGGNDTLDFPGLQAALRPLRAEDTIKATYFRGGEKKDAQMTLTRRPKPQVPDTPAGAAAALKSAFDQLMTNFMQAAEGISEEAANFRPGKDEWNLKEILAHLIFTERYNQANLSAQISNTNLRGFNTHPPAWIESMLAAYPTKDDMVQAWKNSMAETVALIEKLPDSYVAQKVYYLNTLNNLVNFLPGHAQSHIDQIKTTLSKFQEKV